MKTFALISMTKNTLFNVTTAYIIHVLPFDGRLLYMWPYTSFSLKPTRKYKQQSNWVYKKKRNEWKDHSRILKVRISD